MASEENGSHRRWQQIVVLLLLNIERQFTSFPGVRWCAGATAVTLRAAPGEGAGLGLPDACSSRSQNSAGNSPRQRWTGCAPAAGNFTLNHYDLPITDSRQDKSRDAQDPVPILVTGQCRRLEHASQPGELLGLIHREDGHVGGAPAIDRRERPAVGIAVDDHPEGGEYVYSSLTALQARYHDTPANTDTPADTR
jgi:hypothetical protein